MGLPPCDEYILRMLIGQGPNRATPNRPKSNVQPFRSKRLHKSLKFRAEQPNFRSKLFSELLLRLKQPSKPYRRCIAFIICLIDLFADKTLLCSGNLFLGCLPTTDQQLFDGGWSDFFIDRAAFLPCCQIGDAHYLEQRLRLRAGTGRTPFPARTRRYSRTIHKADRRWRRGFRRGWLCCFACSGGISAQFGRFRLHTAKWQSPDSAATDRPPESAASQAKPSVRSCS